MHILGGGNFRSWIFYKRTVSTVHSSVLYFLGVKLRTQATDALHSARETLEDVQTASKKVIETTEWATVALIAVSAVSVLALGIATAAYIRAGQEVAQ